MKSLFGFLNIYKPVGMSSHDVVGCLRRITKIKQIGHTGTLDPFAEGVLPIAVGKATRLIEYLDDDKAYLGRFCFGKATDTYDIEGKVIKVVEEKVTKQEIEKYLSHFEGKIEQYPPIYSAKKINGKKMYELARAGVEVEIKPCEVNIYEIKLLEFNDEEQWADIYIKCSKGTYIRSIANDLGNGLDNACHLSKLKRVEAGLFKVEDSLNLEGLAIEDIEKNIKNPLNFLSLPFQELNEIEYNRTIHGMKVYNRINVEGKVVLSYNGVLAAIGEAESDGIRIKKVFAD